MNGPRKKIDFIFFDAGGGHRSAATALQSVIEQQQRPWEIRLVNLQEVLRKLDIFQKVTGLPMEEVYNLILRRGWTLGSAQLTKIMHGVIRTHHAAAVRVLKQFWAASRPDLLVSLVPNFDRALYQSLEDRTPMVTILTDMADYPPHFWIEKGQRQYFICGTERAVEQARNLGHTDDRIFRASGMILRPKFYEPITVDRAAEREKLGLKPDKTTGLVLFGGAGSSVMPRIAKRVDADVQMIFICGRNQKLAEKLKRAPARFPMSVQGFTSEVPYFMHLSDFFIGKPGPGSISEAIAMKLPVMVERNAWTLPQERYNAEWVLENEVGVVLKSFRDVNAGIEKLLAPGDFERFRANAARMNNRAVFEIPDMLAAMLESRK